MWSSIKTHGSKAMTRNTFHGDPRPSLCTSGSQVDRQVGSHSQAAKKKTSKLLLSKNFLAPKLRSVVPSRDVHASSRSILATNFILTIKALDMGISAHTSTSD